MAANTVSFRTACSVGLFFSSLFVGANLCVSMIVIPTLLLRSTAAPPNDQSQSHKPGSGEKNPGADLSQGLIAQQWQSMYDKGRIAGPIAALGALVSMSVAGRSCNRGSVQQQLLFLAAGLCIAILPFTGIIMWKTNAELQIRAAKAGVFSRTHTKSASRPFSEHSTPDLMRRWSTLNLMRASLHMAASVCAIVAISM